MKKLLAILLLALWPSWVEAANRFWVGGTNTWNSTAASKWSTTSGGAGGASVPGSGDIAIFDANSGGGTVSIGGGIPTIGGLNMSAAATMTLAGSPNMTVNGNVTLGTNVTYTYVGTMILTGTLVSFNPNGVSVSFSLELNNSGGNHSLAGPFSSTGGITITTLNAFNTNNHAITVASFSIPSLSNLSLGSSPITLTGTGTAWNLGTVPTFNVGTSTIKFTNATASGVTFAGNGKAYNIVWFSRGSSVGTNTITGANTFSEFRDDGSAAHQIIFPSATTQTFTTFTVNGNPGALISLRSSTPSSQHTLSKLSGTVNADYLNIQDSNASGGAIWEPGANSIDSGNNTGWNFPAPPVSAIPTFAIRSP